MNACSVCGKRTEGFCGLCFEVICSEECEEVHATQRIASCEHWLDDGPEPLPEAKPTIRFEIDQPKLTRIF